MGGYGALKFGLKSPGNFIFAGSMSGALGIASWIPKDLTAPAAIVFGPASSETRKQNDVFELLRAMPANRIAGLPYFYLDCGTEDQLAGDSSKFAVLLREKQIPHEYRELPGNHNWAYWDQQVPEVLKLAAEHLRMPPAPAMKSLQKKQTKRERVGQ